VAKHTSVNSYVSQREHNMSDSLCKIFERIYELQCHQEAVGRAMAAACRLSQRANPTVEATSLIEALCQAELNQWRQLLMGALSITQDERDRIKAAVYERFLSDEKDVRHYFCDGQNPGRWLQADEQQFRTMVRELYLGCSDETAKQKDAKIAQLTRLVWDLNGIDDRVDAIIEQKHADGVI
jgi:hypothetical protein